MRKNGDFINLIIIGCCVACALMAVYWTAAIVLAGVMVVFGLFTGLASRLFRWPVQKVAIPAAMSLQIGKTRPAAWLGILVVGACLAGSVMVIRELHAPALRRLGQGYTQFKEWTGHADLINSVTGEGIGHGRLERWQNWIWAEEVRDDDLERLALGANPIPAALLHVTARVDDWGRALERRIFEGERHTWFIYAYWFLAAVLAPSALAAFLLTVYQLSARRLAINPGVIAMFLVSLTTLTLSYALFGAFYLFPYVSHPRHTPGIPFWVATLVYFIAAAMCCGVVRANQRALFSPDSVPDHFDVVRKKEAKKRK